MRAVIQRVSRAAVAVDGDIVGSIETGLAVLVGVAEGDGTPDADALADKLVGLRIFNDRDGKMNLSVADVGGAVLVVSQFTLLGDARRGRRPSFVGAALPEVASPLVDRVAARIRDHDIAVATGSFGAMMEVSLVNDGPVTLVIDIVDGKIR